MMTYNYIKKLHDKNNPLVLKNVWDEESCKLVKHEQQVIATSSFAIADRLGFQDGEKIPFKVMLSELKKICDCTEIPISVDIEQGYAETLEELSKNINSLIQIGVSAINIEDLSKDRNSLLSIEEFIKKIVTIKQVGNDIFINARSDIFFGGCENMSNSDRIKEAIKRGNEYYKAGADSFFLPGLKNPNSIKAITSKISIPLNIMLDGFEKPSDYTDLGISRFSYGPSLYLIKEF